MTAKGSKKKPRKASDDWLLEGMDASKAKRSAASHGKTSQWLEVSEEPDRRAAPPAPRRDDGRSARFNAQRNRRLESKLRRALEQNRLLQDKVEELRRQIAELEARASTRTKRAKPKATANRSRVRQIELNSASFEDLRRLGLSVTQSARLIATRDLRGGFKKFDEVDDLIGFPSETIEDLKRRTKLGSRAG